MDLKLSLKITSRICLCYFINGFYHQKEKLKHLLSKLKYNKVCYRVSSERQPVGTAPVLPQHQVTWPRYELVHHHRIIKWKKVKENVPKRPRMGKKMEQKENPKREKTLYIESQRNKRGVELRIQLCGLLHRSV